jgi:hypothetical protein
MAWRTARQIIRLKQHHEHAGNLSDNRRVLVDAACMILKFAALTRYSAALYPQNFLVRRADQTWRVTRQIILL